MAIRYVFRCEICGIAPDEQTRGAIAGQCGEDMVGEFIDAMPGKWLVWHAGGLLGPARYACRAHRTMLIATLRYHYAYTGEQWVWQRPPFAQRWPTDGPVDADGTLTIPQSLVSGERPRD